MAAAGLNKRFDFAAEAARLFDANTLITSDGELTIVGGAFSEKRLGDFIKAWNFTQMTYRLWEYADRITFVEPDVTNEELFERGRVFGDGGDLSLRRDPNLFLWHFVGPKTTVVPRGFGEKDFWAENPHVQLRQTEERALLWGKLREAKRWHDNRVGRAELHYPHPDVERLQVEYAVYTEGGQVAFVWWKSLQEAK